MPFTDTNPNAVVIPIHQLIQTQQTQASTLTKFGLLNPQDVQTIITAAKESKPTDIVTELAQRLYYALQQKSIQRRNTGDDGPNDTLRIPIVPLPQEGKKGYIENQLKQFEKLSTRKPNKFFCFGSSQKEIDAEKVQIQSELERYQELPPQDLWFYINGTMILYKSFIAQKAAQNLMDIIVHMPLTTEYFKFHEDWDSIRTTAWSKLKKRKEDLAHSKQLPTIEEAFEIITCLFLANPEKKGQKMPDYTTLKDCLTKLGSAIPHRYSQVSTQEEKEEVKKNIVELLANV